MSFHKYSLLHIILRAPLIPLWWKCQSTKGTERWAPCVSMEGLIQQHLRQTSLTFGILVLRELWPIQNTVSIRCSAVLSEAEFKIGPFTIWRQKSSLFSSNHHCEGGRWMHSPEGAPPFMVGRMEETAEGSEDWVPAKEWALFSPPVKVAGILIWTLGLPFVGSCHHCFYIDKTFNLEIQRGKGEFS